MRNKDFGECGGEHWGDRRGVLGPERPQFTPKHPFLQGTVHEERLPPGGGPAMVRDGGTVPTLLMCPDPRWTLWSLLLTLVVWGVQLSFF